MPMRAVLDSNFIIALIVEDDENHLDALSTWKHVDAAYLPVIAASEIAYFLLRYHIDLSVLSEVLRDPRIRRAENTLSRAISVDPWEARRLSEPVELRSHPLPRARATTLGEGGPLRVASVRRTLRIARNWGNGGIARERELPPGSHCPPGFVDSV